ncbi:MAG: DUF488 domain-containing protein [Candidatus Hodarchaeales archaeon]|jgi:uncharacterized protein (DUF488 family)
MIFSFGHSNLSVNDFLNLLRAHQIRCLIDVRSIPYGTYRKHFSKSNLFEILTSQNIEYLFLGEELGGKGEIAYPQKLTTELFTSGIEKIILLDKKSINIGIMCAERDEKHCHRRFITEFLTEKEINVKKLPETPQKSLRDWL